MTLPRLPEQLGFRSPPGMKLPVHVTQTAAGHVRVNLRRADIRVAEEFLDDPQVGAVFQQVRGKAVPQHVWRDVP